jgi:hypothetical protein
MNSPMLLYLTYKGQTAINSPDDDDGDDGDDGNNDDDDGDGDDDDGDDDYDDGDGDDNDGDDDNEMMMTMFTLKRLQRGCLKSNPTQKCKPAKGISKRVNMQIIKDTDIIYLVLFHHFYHRYFHYL